jgi:hypothetical protein
MATYVNNLRLKEIATGDESGTWGTSTNTNLELIGEGLGYGTEQVAADSNETFTMADGAADGVRAMYLKFTSAGSLSATRTLTLAPNTVSKVWIIENATSGSQIITIKQGAGATVNVASGARALVYTDGAGAGAAVFTADPSLVVDLTSEVTGTLPIANGGTNATSTTYCSLTANVSGTLPVANGGTGITSLGTGVAAWWGTPSSANLATAVTDETGSGSLVFATSPTFVTPVLGTPSSGTLSGCTVDGTAANTVGFRNIPQNSQSAPYTLVLADAGKHILHPAGDASTRTFTIPANASVAYVIGTAVTFINMTSQVVTIAITSDTMYLSDAGTTGSRSLAQYGSATAIKITATNWVISGSGLT